MDFKEFAQIFKGAFPIVIDLIYGKKLTLLEKDNSVEGFFTYREKVFWYCVYLLNNRPILTIRTAKDYSDLGGGINHNIKIDKFETLGATIEKTLETSPYVIFETRKTGATPYTAAPCQ